MVTSAMTRNVKRTPHRRLHGNAVTQRRMKMEKTSWMQQQQVHEAGYSGAVALDPTTTGKRRMMTRTTNHEIRTSTNGDEVEQFSTSCRAATAANEAPRANYNSPRYRPIAVALTEIGVWRLRLMTDNLL